jgi:glyoxylase-like metal-dependent hydrolase (beta-lactamase superfamily II)
LLTDSDSAPLIDSGYVTHQAQTVALIENALKGRSLDRLVNTHLHSDHCGGNAILQAQYPEVKTFIPPGESAAVQIWNEPALSYQPTASNVPDLNLMACFQAGHQLRMANFRLASDGGARSRSSLCYFV